MNDSTINTEKFKTQRIKHEKNDTNNHGYSFFNHSGNTNLQYSTNTTGYTTFNEFSCSDKKFADYCINLDKYVCTVITKNNCRQLDKYGTDKILITKHNNNKTKYRYGYIITFENEEFCEVFAKTTNKETNTLYLKILNHQLYTSDWTHRLFTVMNDLNFQDLEHDEIHIAVDGEDVLKQKIHFRDYLKNSSVVNGNGNLKIDGDYFNKNLRDWETINVGVKKSGKTVCVYNKSNELQKSKKDYIKRFWNDNG